MKLRGVLIAAVLLTPTAALAAPGMVTESVGLRAGPGPGFPMVDRIPAGARVNVHGCLKSNAWCDVSWSDDRGWVSAQYLEYLYRNHYVYLPDYVDEVDVPVVPFVLSSYWSDYYSGRPWYHRRAYWNSYWSSHERDATRLTLDPRAARIGRAATREGAIATGHGATVGQSQARVGSNEHATVGVNERGAQVRAPRQAEGSNAAAQARMTRENAPGRAAQHVQQNARAPMHQPMARGHEAPRLSAAPARPAAPHIAQQPSHGAPMNAHAQMPAPRAAAPAPHAAPAMPHGGGGGAPHIGGGHAGGASGHEKH